VIPTFALIVQADADLILLVKECLTLEPGSISWYLHMCWAAGRPADALAAGVSLVSAIGLAKLLRWFAGNR
jgi:hypothetical protein